jgi:hypothetical protein
MLVADFLPDRLLRRVRNLAEAFLGGFLFDKWTCNCDGRQVVFYRSAGSRRSSEGATQPYSAWLIDHGFCFNDGDWNFPDSSMRSLYGRRLVYHDVRGFDSFEPFLSRIENVESDQLETCMRGIPTAWCGEKCDQLGKLIAQLYARRRRLRQAIVDAKNSTVQPFPNWE